MPRIEGIRIENYKALRDVQLGRLWDSPESVEPLTSLSAVIGKNGSGKSSLVDAFAFLRDSLLFGVVQACELNQRGGYDRLRSSGSDWPISFSVHYRDSKSNQPLTYTFIVDKDPNDRPFVLSEILFTVNAAAKVEFLHVSMNEAILSGEESSVRLNDPQRLALSTFGSLSNYPQINGLQQFLESWYFSGFSPEAARSLPFNGAQSRLSARGDNIANVVQFLQRDHPDQFAQILKRIAAKIPGIDRIEAKKTEDGRVLLSFNDKAFLDPFLAHQVSDGTLKFLAYLLLLEDPDPPPFICIEEPENGRYQKLLEGLLAEFRSLTLKEKHNSQVFLTTHQPYVIDSLKPNEVWMIRKGADGFAVVQRASDNLLVAKLSEQEIPLGSLWYSDYLDAQ